MNKLRQIKKTLGSQYCFRRFMNPWTLRKAVTSNSLYFVQPAARLTAGCVKLEAVIYSGHGRLQLGYDMFVKDAPNRPEWICYEHLQEPVRLGEREMFRVLDRAVEQYGLSYTECPFPIVKGIEPM